jgi:hypothetical protein
MLSKRQELMLQIDEKFFIDSQQPFLKPQGRILEVELALEVQRFAPLKLFWPT